MKKSIIRVTVLLAAILIAASCKKEKEPEKTSLDAWIGTYTVTAVSTASPGVYDETWTVTAAAVDTNDTMLQYTGFCGAGSGPVFATLDPDALTISFKSNQSLHGNIYGYGNTLICYASDDIIANVNNPVTQAVVNAAAAFNIEGTIEEEGNMAIGKLGIIVEGPQVYDVFTTTWEKQ